MNDALMAKGTYSETCAARESAQATLRGHADRLRRQAGELHQEADRVEQLANVCAGLSGPAEEALWRLAINYRSQPRNLF